MPEGGFIGADEGMSWELYAVAAGAIAKAHYMGEVDQEDTLLVQLTTPEVGMFTLGALLAARLFPELFPVSAGITKKVMELSDVQEFFPAPSDGGSTVEEE